MRTKFITSAAQPKGFPKLDLPEIAFVGRSNVGKSSLLNALTGAKIARTSQTPGRTQLINFFTLHTGEGDVAFADLPGFGYARAPKAVVHQWRDLSRAYLSSRSALHAVLLLLDLRRGVQPHDLELFTWLSGALPEREEGAPVEIRVVGTKADKLSKSQRGLTRAKMAQTLGLPKDRVICTSTTKKMGVEDLRALILSYTQTHRASGGYNRSSVLTGSKPDE